MNYIFGQNYFESFEIIDTIYIRWKGIGPAVFDDCCSGGTKNLIKHFHKNKEHGSNNRDICNDTSDVNKIIVVKLHDRHVLKLFSCNKAVGIICMSNSV